MKIRAPKGYRIFHEGTIRASHICFNVDFKGGWEKTRWTIGGNAEDFAPRLTYARRVKKSTGGKQNASR